MTRVTSVRLDDEVASKLDRLATSLDRSKAWIIEQAITTYIEEQAWQIEAITDALEEYRAGRSELVPHEDVMARLESKLRDRR
jgi:predicted transcriptional regulator